MSFVKMVAAVTVGIVLGEFAKAGLSGPMSSLKIRSAISYYLPF